jgi:hypothetical protein
MFTSMYVVVIGQDEERVVAIPRFQGGGPACVD